MDIITDNLDQEFKMQKSALNRRLGNYTSKNVLGVQSTIVDRNSLPSKFRKKTAFTMPGSAMGVNMKMGAPTFYHPLFQPVNMLLPRDRRERNEWCRHFYRTENIIATAIDLHTELPISDFNNQCGDKAIKRFFDYMAFDKLDIINTLLKIGHEYWKIGDVFAFGQLNEDEGMWEKFVVLNPDFVDIQSSIFAEEPMIEMIPDEKIRTIVTEGPRGTNAELYNQIPEDVIRDIKMGRNIKLDNRRVSHIAHKASDYEIWGTPLMMRCFKTLIYKDKLRGAQDAIANRHIFPIRVAKVGQAGEPMPEQNDLDSLRDTLMAVQDDPNSFVVYHYGLQFDYVGSNGKLLPLNQEFDFIEKELMNGLGINQALLNGDGPTYANAQVGMDALAKRYMSYRLKLEYWLKHKVYKPIAEIQGFYKPVNGEVATAHLREREIRRLAERKDMQLVIPEIRWQQMDLTSNQSAMQLITQLQGKGLVSTQTMHQIVGLDPETEKNNIEAERGTVFDQNAPKTGPLPNTNSPMNSVSNIPSLNLSKDQTETPFNSRNLPEAPSNELPPPRESSLTDFFEKRANLKGKTITDMEQSNYSPVKRTKQKI